MLILHPFESWEQLFGIPTFSNQQLGAVKIICPSPQIADAVRFDLAGKVEFDYGVITISRFINDLMTQFPEIQERYKLLRKSELLFELGALFKKKFLLQEQGGVTPNFDRLFKVFTEVRGITTDASLIDEFLQTLDETEAKILFYFFKYVELMNFSDEHEMYRLLSNAVIDCELNEADCFIFYGFKHLSGQQIDFLKSFAAKHHVVVTAPESFLAMASKSDWTSWLGFTAIDRSISQKHQPAAKPTLNILYFNRGDVSSKIKAAVNMSSGSFGGLLLASARPSLEEVLAIPVADIATKSPMELFEFVKAQWDIELKLIIPDPVSQISLESLLEKVTATMAKAIKNKDFVYLKLLQTWTKNLTEWGKFGEQFQFITSFDLSVIAKKVELDLPRINGIVLNNSDLNIQIEGLSASFSVSEKPYIVVASRDTFAVGGDLHDLASAWELLSSVGPMHSKDFELADRQEKLFKILSRPSSIILLENGLEHHDAEWSEFVGRFEKNVLEISGETIGKIADPLLDIPLSRKSDRKLSPSTLQMYWDCPRKYYYSVESQAKPISSNLGDVTFAQQGQIAHALIQNYMEAKEPVEQNVDKLLSPFRNSEYRLLNDLEFNRIRLEIFEQAQNGIELVRKILSTYPGSELSFEHSYENEKFRGRADLVIHKDNQLIGIFDFKRSDSSIPSKEKFFIFDKLQMWFYLRRDGRFPKIFGYLNLKDPKSSRLYTTDKMLDQQWSPILNEDPKFTPKIAEVDDLLLYSSQYVTLEDRLNHDLNNDHRFVAKPRTDDVCQYCHLTLICKKGID